MQARPTSRQGRLPRMLVLALLAAVLAVAAACGGAGNGGDTLGEVGTEALPPVEEELEGGEFTSAEFEPQFTIELPGGWLPAEDEPGTVQLFSGDTSERVLTFSSRLSNVGVADAVAQMRATENLNAEEPTDAAVAGNQGQRFEANVQSGYSTDLQGLDYLAIDGFELRVWTIDVGGSTVVIIADAPAADANDFFTEVDEVLGSLQFGPPA